MYTPPKLQHKTNCIWHDAMLLFPNPAEQMGRITGAVVLISGTFSPDAPKVGCYTTADNVTRAETLFLQGAEVSWTVLVAAKVPCS